jgi:hypothetical protein
MAKKTPLDIYDDIPREMRAYLRNYGYSFSRKACEYAISLMKKKGVSGKPEKIEPYTKEKAEELLKKHNITLEHNIGYNFVYVLNMAIADYYKSSIPDEQHLALFVKDYIDDIDGNPENVFRKWLVSMDGDGEPIEWSEIL